MSFLSVFCWLKAFAEFLQPGHAGSDVFHAGGVADAEVVVRTERDAGDGGHLGLLKQSLAKLGRLEACLGDVREQVKRSLAVDAADPGHGVELPGGVAATLVKLGQPVVEVILRAGKGGDRTLLCERGGVAGAVALKCVNRLGDRLGRRDEADALAGH